MFERPLFLFLLLGWAVVVGFFLYRNGLSVAWIRANIGNRFRSRFSAYNKVSLAAHSLFLFLTGAFLVVALSGPYRRGLVDAQKSTGVVILAIDASFSMMADDVKRASWEKRKPATRLAQAKNTALALMNGLELTEIGFLSFSGIAAVHAPPTKDHAAVRRAIEGLSAHYFENTGSSFGSVLSAAHHMLVKRPGRAARVVILSDGEMPFPEKFDTELAALKENNIVVYTIGFGTEKGAGLKIFDPEDLRKGVDNPGIAREITTKRDEDNLEVIASATGGSYKPIEKLSPEKFSEMLLENVDSGNTRVEGKDDYSRFFFALFAIAFLFEIVFLEMKWKIPLPAGIARYLGIVLLSLTFFQCSGSACKAHAANEHGITMEGLHARKKSRLAFEESAAFHYREEIPLFNLGNTTLSDGDASAAHDAYQRALLMRPDFPEALYNDGHALYEWGRKEIDPLGCNLERVKKLWEESAGRFERARDAASRTEPGDDPDLGRKAAENAQLVRNRITQLEALAKKCPGGGGGGAKEQQPSGGDKDKNQQQNQKENNQQKNQPNQQSQNQQQEKKENKSGKGGHNPGKGENKNENDPSGGGGALSQEEKEQVEKELKRIGKQSEGKKFHQTRQQQFRNGGREEGGGSEEGKEKGGKGEEEEGRRGEKGKGGGRPVWW